jgi:hypothetical protein
MLRKEVFMPRDITGFNGKGVVIGCSHNHSFCRSTRHADKQEFFTIDMDHRQSPDLTFNITDSELPVALKDRFLLTMTECIDCTAYCPQPLYRQRTEQRQNQSIQGFNNLLAMTQEQGFLLIVGCPRIQDFRNSLRNLKYIESPDQEVVLVPKNQNLTIDEIRAGIQKLHSSLQNAITEKITLSDNLAFCSVNVENMPTVREIILSNRTSTTESQNSIDTRTQQLRGLLRCRLTIFQKYLADLQTNYQDSCQNDPKRIKLLDNLIRDLTYEKDRLNESFTNFQENPSMCNYDRSKDNNIVEKCKKHIDRAINSPLADYPFFKQLCLDFLQTITIIGFILGCINKSRSGRYSLFANDKFLKQTFENIAAIPETTQQCLNVQLSIIRTQ